MPSILRGDRARDLGTEPARDPCCVHGHVVAADRGHPLAHAGVFVAGYFLQHPQVILPFHPQPVGLAQAAGEEHRVESLQQLGKPQVPADPGIVVDVCDRSRE